MSEIATYRCDNEKCRRTIHLSKDFPIWKSDTPLTVRSRAVTPELEQHVERYRTESYCVSCRRTVEITLEATCANCNANLLREHFGTRCIECRSGVFALAHLSIR